MTVPEHDARVPSADQVIELLHTEVEILTEQLQALQLTDTGDALAAEIRRRFGIERAMHGHMATSARLKARLDQVSKRERAASAQLAHLASMLGVASVHDIAPRLRALQEGR